ncbi:MAG: hypothetical protein FJX78_03560 [Armatimonadetes bacterium]|nr:hypothetical protein [Armatimonadota bacterium]
MTLKTDALGALLIGEPDRVFDAVRTAYAAAAARGAHAVLSLHLSRGCPGEPDGDCDPQGRPMA